MQCLSLFHHTATPSQCEYEPCMNGGTCTSVEGACDQYMCTCSPGFTGVNCEIGKFYIFLVKILFLAMCCTSNVWSCNPTFTVCPGLKIHVQNACPQTVNLSKSLISEWAHFLKLQFHGPTVRGKAKPKVWKL